MAKQLTLEEMKEQQAKFYEEEENREKGFKEAEANLDTEGLLKAAEEQNTDPPIPEPKPEPAPEPAKPSAEEQKRTDGWEHRFRVLEGMYKKDKAELEGIVNSLKEKSSALEDEVKRLRNVETEPPKPDTKQQETLDKLADTFGVDNTGITNLTELIKSISASEADKRVKEVMDSVGKDIGSVRETVNKSAQQVYIDKLTDSSTGFADAVDVLQDTEFSAWLKEELMYDSIARSDREHDATTVLKAIKKYKEATKPAPNPEEEAAEAARKAALEEMAQPAKGHGAKPPAPEKKTYTAADVAAYMKRYLARDDSLYKDGQPRPAAKTLYEDMKAAATEGRIISP